MTYLALLIPRTRKGHFFYRHASGIVWLLCLTVPIVAIALSIAAQASGHPL
jgi:hypothetical protein